MLCLLIMACPTVSRFELRNRTAQTDAIHEAPWHARWWETRTWTATCCTSVIADLRESILRLEMKGISIQGRPSRSNVGGWQSSTKVLDSDLPGIENVRDAAYHMVAMYLSNAVRKSARGLVYARMHHWVNVNRMADSNKPHVHEGFLSGVFYMDSTSAHDTGGELCWIDPRPQVRSTWSKMISAGWLRREPTDICMAPKPGLLVIFPSWLEHFVTPLRIDAARVSLSFNVNIELSSREQELPLTLQVPTQHGGGRIRINIA